MNSKGTFWLPPVIAPRHKRTRQSLLFHLLALRLCFYIAHLFNYLLFFALPPPQTPSRTYRKRKHHLGSGLDSHPKPFICGHLLVEI